MKYLLFFKRHYLNCFLALPKIKITCSKIIQNNRALFTPLHIYNQNEKCCHDHLSSPQSTMVTFCEQAPLLEPTFFKKETKLNYNQEKRKRNLEFKDR
jgi:hypothetical protein